MFGILAIWDKLIKRRQIKHGFEQSMFGRTKQRTRDSYSILKYKTGKDINESLVLHDTLEAIVVKYPIRIILDGEWKRRKNRDLELNSVPEEMKMRYTKILDYMEQGLPTQMVCYKDCYLIVLEQDVLGVKEFFQRINYLIEDVAIEEFNKFIDKENRDENYYQTIASLKGVTL